MRKFIYNNRFQIALIVMIIIPFDISYASEPEIGRCHMNYCSWGALMRKEIVGEKNDARLIKASIVGGTSYHNGGDYPDKYSKKIRIKWARDPHSVYALCYTKLPIIAVGDQYTVLDFNNIPGVLESDASLYVRICYGVEGVKAFAGDFVKSKGLGNPIVEEVKVSSPSELLKYVR